MILFDANLLVQVFRSDAVNHQTSKEWVESIINGPDPYGVSPQALATFVRICTHPRVFVRPSPLSDALKFCRVLLEQPNAVVVNPGQRHWAIFESLCEAFGVTGNSVQMAWFAAMAIESDCEWTTTDPQYSRFKKVFQ